MINNPSVLDDIYAIRNKAVIRHLLYSCHLPLLSVEGEKHYFLDNEKLRKSLEEMPVLLKASFLLFK